VPVGFIISIVSTQVAPYVKERRLNILLIVYLPASYIRSLTARVYLVREEKY